MSSWPELRGTFPQVEVSSAKSSTTSGQLELWSVLVDLSSDGLPSQNGIFLTFPKLLHFGPSTFLYLSMLQLWWWIVIQYCTCAWNYNCQSDRSPERLMISHTPSIGGTSNQFRWEKECGGNTPSFWGEFLQNPYFSKQDIPNLPNCGILDLPHLCIINTTNYGSEKLYSTMHVHWSYNLSIWEDSWKIDYISDPGFGGTSNQLRWGLQNSSFSKQDISNLPKLWNFGPSTFLYLSILQQW